MDIYYSSHFKKQYKKLPKKVRVQFQERLMLFVENENHVQLHMHQLSGTYKGLWSMNITGDVRAIFDRSYDETILFIAVGTHSQLYK